MGNALQSNSPNIFQVGEIMTNAEEKGNNVVQLPKPRESIVADLNDGFTMLADQLIDALCKVGLSGNEYQVALAVIRKTYGFKKKADYIANSQLADITGLTVNRISKVLNSLVERRVINIRKGSYIKEISINKNTQEWQSKQNAQKSKMCGEKGKMLDQKGKMCDQKSTNNIELELDIEKTYTVDSDEPTPQVENPSSNSPAPKKPDSIETDFKEIWEIKPKREGANPRNKALSAYRARRKEGHTHHEIIQGVIRYTSYLRAKGSIGTPYVQQMATFLGTNKGFQEAWGISNASKCDRSQGNQQGREAEIEARRSRLRGETRQGSVVARDPLENDEERYSNTLGFDG